MEAELKTLKNQRKQVKAALTRFSKYVLGLNATDFDEGELLLRKTDFDTSLNSFNRLQSAIELLDEKELDENDREAFEQKYYETRARVLKLLKNVAQAVSEMDDDSSVQIVNADGIATDVQSESIEIKENVQSEGTNNFQQMSNRVKLPQIVLPTFSGAFDEWYSFYDTFNSLVHSDNSLSIIEKFHYLKSSLKGDAAEVIRALEIRISNYETAWEMLKERFDNKRAIIQKHIKSIFEIVPLKRENYAGLRQLLDGVQKHIRALKALERPTENWDDLVVYLIVSKLDFGTVKAWEMSLETGMIPTYSGLMKFLSQRCSMLEAASKSDNSSSYLANGRKLSINLATKVQLCAMCKGEHHQIRDCEQFLNLSIDSRLECIKAKHLCMKCLRAGHRAHYCKARGCFKCGGRHHVLIHRLGNNQSSNAAGQNLDVPNGVNSSNSSVEPVINGSHCYVSIHHGEILLPTAIVKVLDVRNRVHLVRCLLDCGSQSSFVTKNLAAKLGINRFNVQIPIQGISSFPATISEGVVLNVQSRVSGFSTTVKGLVLGKITGNLPTRKVAGIREWIPSDISLADPSFDTPGEIDILLGSDVFWNLVCGEQIKTDTAQVVLQNTLLGWIVCGPSSSAVDNAVSANRCHVAVLDRDLNESLTRFWELENVADTPKGDVRENVCEKDFKETVKRNVDGRFIVHLPVKKEILSQLGDSRAQAMKRFFSLERRLLRDRSLATEYSKFINEYVQRGHMTLLNADENMLNTGYYLPHHAVVKSSSLTTKLRVVFDASAKTTTGVSLNDALETGPLLQQELISILMRFRFHKFVLLADIEKMYRQVLIQESQTPLQRILWRDNPDTPVRTYELLTLTYGTTPASFLAIRSLHQLAIENANKYPIGAQAIRRDFYVDDFISGADSLEEARVLRDETIKILEGGCFPLRKWLSNSRTLTDDLQSRNIEHMIVNLDKSNDFKTLGVQWDAERDVFSFENLNRKDDSIVTKRTVLGQIAQIFDPLGLLGPVIVVGKIIMQRLWMTRIGWDEQLPNNVFQDWVKYRSGLQELRAVRVPRWLRTGKELGEIEFHGFCDASEAAYGACIYVVSRSNDETSSRLLCSKSRVAPIKSVSLPKLELCGAVLLARLMKAVREAVPMCGNKNKYYWTDSKVVLDWLGMDPNTLKTFVSNRVSEIQQSSERREWRHIRGVENPADIISRGIQAKLLSNQELWWYGPAWLVEPVDQWPIVYRSNNNDEVPEVKRFPALALVVMTDDSIFSRFSNFNRLIRVVGYMLRFKYKNTSAVNGTDLHVLSVQELTRATNCVIRVVQQASFCEDVSRLNEHKPVNNKSTLLPLCPFVDSEGLIRVGGRLRYSKLSYESKHPILLPHNSHVTDLIISSMHESHLHAGSQQTLAAVRQRYWPIRGYSAVKRVVRKCLICLKASPKPFTPMMSDLPSNRVAVSRPFLQTGVDYFGPLTIREGRSRRLKTTKAYGVVFVCMNTKAIHLDLAVSLSAESFLNVFKRFIARRGKPASMFSDNGTNFVGANRELKELINMLRDENVSKQIRNSLANDGIKWSFIPPRAPHFGGLWEAAVRSAKRHLRRVVGNTILCYDEMYTLCVQIEAILNSRPLCPLSSDPNDPSYLTPSHYLIGDHLTALPEPNMESLPINRLSRWEHITKMRQHFWKRWQREYLQWLQPRKKWIKETGDKPCSGQLVMVMEDGLPPLRWMVGRIQDLHPGKDGIARVATVKTASGIIKRPCVKLCPLLQD